MNTKILNPSDDGITHINVYSKSKCSIGEMLSNFYKCEIDTIDGKFLSVEAYWHYLSLEDSCIDRDKLRELYGYEAKKIGSELIKQQGYKKIDEQFKSKILDAIWKKFIKNQEILYTSFRCDLPFEHYYVFDGRIVDARNKYKWMIDGIERMRDTFLDYYCDCNTISRYEMPF